MKEEEIEFINREKQNEVLKLKTKLKKASKRGPLSKAPSQPKQTQELSESTSLLKSFVFELPAEYEDMI